jgi:ribonuclease HI
MSNQNAPKCHRKKKLWKVNRHSKAKWLLKADADKAKQRCDELASESAKAKEER